MVGLPARGVCVHSSLWGRSAALADASAASDDRDDVPPPNLGTQDARSGLPPLASFGRPANQGNVAGGRPQIDLGPTHSGHGADSMDATDNTLAHRISLRFKDSSSKFSGDPNECLDDFVADYELVCRDYGLSRSRCCVTSTTSLVATRSDST